MNNQEAFDKMVTHLRKQKAKSVYDGAIDIFCCYRGSENRMCAVGVLIPDSEYKQEYEGSIEKSYSLFPSLHDIDLELLIAMQRLHDRAPWSLTGDGLVDYWNSIFPEIAERFSLTVPEVK